MTTLDVLKKYLIGKKVRHKNQHNRTVELKVEDVTFHSHEVELEAATQANDWWPNSYTVNSYYLQFEDGSKIEMTPSTEIEVIE